jgi:hypothetical protein
VDEWRWTSHAATVGTTAAGVVAVAEVLSYLGADTRSVRARYLELVSDASEPSLPSHPLLDGDDGFVEAQLARLRSSPEHPRASVRPRRPALADLVSSRDDTARSTAASESTRLGSAGVGRCSASRGPVRNVEDLTGRVWFASVVSGGQAGAVLLSRDSRPD